MLKIYKSLLITFFSLRTVNNFSLTDEIMNKFRDEIIEFIEKYIYL
jgi:hypothetical protein